MAIAWVKDGSGFYYTRFPEPGTVPAGDEHYFNRVYYHRLGDPQERDTLIFEKPAERETVFGVEISDDDRWVVITAFQGSSDKSEIYLLDRDAPGAAPAPLFTGFASAYAFIEAAAFNSGQRRVSSSEQTTARPAAGLSGSIPRGPTWRRWRWLRNRPTSCRRRSSSTARSSRRTCRTPATASGCSISRAGPAGTVDLPAIGSVSGISGRPEDDEMFVGFSSFVYPPANYRYDFAAKALEPFGRAAPRVDPADYETTQVWYPSKDGTNVSMFLVRRTGLPKDGERPVLLTGYGGFNISLTPAFDPANFVLIDKGGIYAVANLRGGGEYGEAWHEAGMFGRKQNVFDDFIAAAEWLTASGWSNPKRRLRLKGAATAGCSPGR